MQNYNEAPKLMVENISCILPESTELGGLFLGNVFGAQNVQILKEYGIRAIITASAQTKINHSFLDIPFQLKIDAHDKEDYYITEHINQCIHFIQQNRKLTNVFVHCYAGVSRSTAIVAAYLMWKYRWTLQKTIKFLTFKRIAAKPNEGFYRQLKDIQAKLNIVAQNTTAAVTYTPNGHSYQRQITGIKTASIQAKGDQIFQSQQKFNALKVNSTVNSSLPKAVDGTIRPNQFYNNVQYPHKQTLSDGTYFNVAQQRNNLPTQYYNQKYKTSQNFTQKPYQNHSQIPIPRILQKRNSMNQTVRNNKGYDQVKQHIDANLRNHTSSSNVAASPRKHTRQKISVGKRLIGSSGSSSRYLNETVRQSYNDQSLNLFNKQMANIKDSVDWKQKSKISSRGLIRPKDLPGYKNY